MENNIFQSDLKNNILQTCTGLDIDEMMLNTVFAYWAPTNEEKNMIQVDERCVMYNSLYKSFEFYDKKFPEGHENIPGFEKIIEKIVERAYDNSPLIEITSRQLNRE